MDNEKVAAKVQSEAVAAEAKAAKWWEVAAQWVAAHPKAMLLIVAVIVVLFVL